MVSCSSTHVSPGAVEQATVAVSRGCCNYAAPLGTSDHCGELVRIPRLEHQECRCTRNHRLPHQPRRWVVGSVGGKSCAVARRSAVTERGPLQIVFANAGSISKTTGADKHTSAFLFGNTAAASSQKKALRKGE